MIKIKNIEDPRVQEFKSLRDSNVKTEGLLIAESYKVVLKLLNSNFEVLKLFITKEFFDENHSQINISEDNIFYADHSIMEKIVGHRLHHGIMASAHRPNNVPLTDLGKRILILNGLSSPENVGTIIRTAAGFNINSVIIDSKTCSPYLRRCIRVSMGNIFNMNIHFCKDLKSTLIDLQESKYSIYATANIEGATDLKDVVFNERSAFITGSEGHGIDSEIITASDEVIRIPMNETVAHLNAACATSIVLYHFQ
jgi:TrmH family RNA methyltransferase